MLNILKPLTFIKRGKQKKLIIPTFKASTYLILNFANTIWSPIISNINIRKLQIIQNTALYIATGCKKNTNDETSILPMGIYLKLHITQLKQLTQHTYIHYIGGGRVVSSVMIDCKCDQHSCNVKPYCCVLQKDTLQQFPLLGNLSKQL